MNKETDYNGQVKTTISVYAQAIVPLVLLWGTWRTKTTSASASAAPTTFVWWPTATRPTSGACAGVIHCALAEPRDVRSVTQKQDKDVSSAVFSLFHIYQHQALVDESPHTPGYSCDNVVSYVRVPNYHAHGHSHATVSNILDNYVCQSYVFFYRGFSRLHTRARPPVLSEAEVADIDHPYDTL